MERELLHTWSRGYLLSWRNHRAIGDGSRFPIVALLGVSSLHSTPLAAAAGVFFRASGLLRVLQGRDCFKIGYEGGEMQPNTPSFIARLLFEARFAADA